MKKPVYIIVNVVAIIICLFLIVMGAIIVKLFGLAGLIYIIYEFASGRYKKYID